MDKKTPSATTPAHAEEPWTYRLDPSGSGELWVYDADGHCIASVAFIGDDEEIDPEKSKANARLLITSTKLLHLAVAYRQECADQILLYRDDLKNDRGDPDDMQMMIDYWEERRDRCIAAIRQACGNDA